MQYILTEKKISTITYPKKYFKIIENTDIDFDQIFTVKMDNNVLLQQEYLRNFLKNEPLGTKNLLAFYYIDTEIVAYSVFQFMQRKLAETYKLSTNTSFKSLKSTLLNYFDFRVLMVGNMMITGEHAYAYDVEKISESDFSSLYFDAIKYLEQKYKPAIVIMKDYLSQDSFISSFLAAKYYCYSSEPSMKLEINPSWENANGYIDSMTKKYRARVRTARNKAQFIEKKLLTLAQIRDEETIIFKLYENIASQASFNLFTLPKTYFSRLKEDLGAKFEVVAYYNNTGKMLGFFSVIRNANQIDTHFLGYCPIANKEAQLYLNMLLDMTMMGIYEQKEAVIFGRTAVEIKSTIGAKPEFMKAYYKFCNPIIHKIAPYVIQFVSNPKTYIFRNPFKET